MVLYKCYRYRFYPTPTQQEHLIRILGHCQELYNAALFQRREAYRVCGINVTYGMQQNELPALKEEQPRLREVGSQALHLWHVCFSCVLDKLQPPTPDRPATALDVGLDYFATLADGSHIDNPRFFRKDEQVLAQRQRRRDHKTHGSKNRRRATLLVAKAHRRIRNKRANFHHQEARKIVDRHGAIAIEGLRIKNMVRNHCLAKSISDAGWNQFLTILTRKAEEAGVVVVVVNPAGTSQVCSRCGRPVPKTLSDRWHTCPYEDCGLSLQRDHNAARNIFNRAGLARAGG